MAVKRNSAIERLFESNWLEDFEIAARNMNFPNGFKELDVEIERSSGRIFVKDGLNLMNYIKNGKVWVINE